MVDAERLGARLELLERLIEQVEEVQRAGVDAYLGDEGLRAATERRLQLVIHACLDIGAQLVSELSARPPSDYADVFASLAEGDYLDRDLARRLAVPAEERNVLVHAYVDLDDRRIFASLSRLDDLRRFGVSAQELADRY